MARHDVVRQQLCNLSGSQSREGNCSKCGIARSKDGETSTGQGVHETGLGDERNQSRQVRISGGKTNYGLKTAICVAWRNQHLVNFVNDTLARLDIRLDHRGVS